MELQLPMPETIADVEREITVETMQTPAVAVVLVSNPETLFLIPAQAVVQLADVKNSKADVTVANNK